VFPSLINDLPGTTDEAWSALTYFDRPFLTLWAANDPGAQGSCEAQQYLIDSVHGAAGQPHDRLEEAGHFLQDDQGEEIGRRLVDFYSSSSIALDLTGGRVARFLDKDGTAKDKAVVKFVRDPAIVAPLPDPTVDSSSLRMLADTGDTCTVHLDQSKWRPSGSGFVYRFSPEESPPGGIYKVVFKPGRSGGKLFIKAKGDGYGTRAISGPVAWAQAQFSVGPTTYAGRFKSPPAEEKSNTAEKILLKGKNASVPVNPGHELFDPSGFPNLVVWGTQDLSIAEYDALTPPQGWFRNQPREGVGARGRFLRSPGRDADGDFTRQEMFGVSWLHQATIVSIDGSLDPQGLLTASTVEKHHELSWCAGSSITILTSPEGARYILVSRDARRTFDTPTIPDGWMLEVILLEEDLRILLPLHTTVIRADNEDSFQGPLPSDLDL
jgi:hypothetical protein